MTTETPETTSPAEATPEAQGVASVTPQATTVPPTPATPLEEPSNPLPAHTTPAAPEPVGTGQGYEELKEALTQTLATLAKGADPELVEMGKLLPLKAQLAYFTKLSNLNSGTPPAPPVVPATPVTQTPEPEPVSSKGKIDYSALTGLFG